jgi:hypothetical protein
MFPDIQAPDINAAALSLEKASAFLSDKLIDDVEYAGVRVLTAAIRRIDDDDEEDEDEKDDELDEDLEQEDDEYEDDEDDDEEDEDEEDEDEEDEDDYDDEDDEEDDEDELRVLKRR